VTHDSDALPGLANRIIARWARLHAVGQPVTMYHYPVERTVEVGVPVQETYEPVTEAAQADFRRQLGLAGYDKIVCVAGGGLGAQRINQALVAIAPRLLAAFPDLAVIHQVGRAHELTVAADYAAALAPNERERVLIKGFVTDMYRLSGAADVIISRAGATNMAEFALQGKAAIIIPNPYLTGGHQLKNAQVLADRHAIVVLPESEMLAQPDRLLELVTDLLKQPAKRHQLAAAVHRLAHPDAAHRLAVLLLEEGKKSKQSSYVQEKPSKQGYFIYRRQP
jgi:UDP-N-acetylglucosamine--N-acetylmuramyl-(pentapeptide) pyrophosphoryl-undecaprenol N-acetylglucosamine transferase